MTEIQPFTPEQWARWRAALGHSLSAAADVLGVTRRHYIRLEQGERRATVSLTLLAVALKELHHNRPL